MDKYDIIIGIGIVAIGLFGLLIRLKMAKEQRDLEGDNEEKAEKVTFRVLHYLPEQEGWYVAFFFGGLKRYGLYQAPANPDLKGQELNGVKHEMLNTGYWKITK